MFAGELQIFLFSVAVLFVFGIPAIVRKTKLPIRFEFREYDDSELTPEQRQFFASQDSGFAEINYQPVKTFAVPNLQGSNLNRAYCNSADPAVAVVTLLRTAKGGRNVQYTEFVTRFTDGTKVNTKNSPVSASMFKTLPNYHSKSFPALQSPVQLKQKHDERTAPLGLQPVFRDPRQYQQFLQEHHEAWAAHQVSNGLLKLDMTGHFRATPLLGFRAVCGYLNPIAGDFTFSKFAAGIVLGAGVPMFAARYGIFASSWLMRTTGINIVLAYSAIFFSSFLLAGISVGSFFRQRSFIWGFLLAYLPPSLFHMRRLYPFFGSLFVAWTADWTAKYHMRRGRLL